ncbi:GM19356 [Drosophila sechellia]|uniref:trypsin n=1 Tax=Drosophila sechellia TaxID=7238 RepID=B4HV91_DROSE|nr:GM19356 [Drosophila sechellia]
MRILALILLLICGHKTSALSPQERIVGGVEVPIQLTPWLTSITVHGNYSCSSALITSQWLVTAGHCVHCDPDSYFVRAGSTFTSSRFHTTYSGERHRLVEVR